MSGEIAHRKRTEEALRESEARAKQAQQQLLDAIESISEGFALYDSDGRLVLCNSTYREYHELVGEHVLPGVRFEDLMRPVAHSGRIPDAAGREEAWLRDRMRRHREAQGVFEVPLTDGRWLRVGERKTSDGGIVVVRSDITELKLAEERIKQKEEQFRNLTEGSNQGVLIHDIGKVHLVNRAYAKIFGYDSPAELLAQSSIYVHVAPQDRRRLKKYARDRLQGRKAPTTYEFQGVKKDGSRIWLENHVRVVNWEGKRAIQRTLVDITERKRAEEELERTQFAIDHASDAALWLDRDGRMVYANTATEMMLGYSREELLTLSVTDYDPDVSLDDFSWAFERIKARSPYTFEARHRTKAGNDLLVEVSVHYMRFGDDELMCSYSRDITERKRAEEELRESEARAAKAQQQLLDAVESIAASFILYDADERLVLCNSTAREFLPEVAELLVPGTNVEDLTRARLDRTMPAAATGQIEKRLRGRLDRFRHPGPAIEEHHTDGRWTQAWERRTADGGTVCIRTDITEIKRAEEKLHTLSSAVEQSPAALVIADTDAVIEYVNPAFTAITGYTREDAIGQNPRILKSGLTPKATYERLWATITAGKTWRGTFYNKRKDGTPYIADASISPIKRADGAIIHFLSAEQDVTERVEAERRLQESEERYRDLYENAPVAYVSVSASDGSILRFNSTLLRLLGYDRDDLKGMSVFDFFADTPDNLPKAKPVYQNFKGDESTRNAELQMKRKDGAVIWISLSIEPVRDAEGKVTESRTVFIDITDRKQAEAQFVQAAKLATVGEMATSVAHELNQPLNVIRMAAGNVMRRLEKGSADAAYLSEKLKRIASQTERAAAIIDHMRMFGREAGTTPILLDPSEAILGALDLVGEQLRLAGIEIVLDFPESCRPVLGHRVQLEQVFLNLLVNARDAIRENPADAERTITLAVDDTGADAVRISVTDTGGGVPKKALSRVFEPFYTTKDMSKGTGLGLSVSYGIVRDMGGTIEVENVEGGARFRIILPVAEEAAEALTPEA